MIDFKRALRAASRIQTVLVLLVLIALVSIPAFHSPNNLLNILDQSAAGAILALGQSFVIAGGLIDLSLGQLVGLATVIVCTLMSGHPELAPVAIVASIALGLVVGLINGELVNRLKVHPLILTFGMLSVLQGFIFLITDRSVGEVAPLVSWLAGGRIVGIPVSLLLVALIAYGAHIMLQRSRFGWHLQAFGHSNENVRRAGINVQSLVRGAFVFSGLSAGIAGIIVSGRLGTGYPHAGDGLELDSIVAVVLGGTPLTGGRASVIGTLCAVLVLGVLNNLMNLMQVPAFTQILVKGLIVVGAILAGRARERAAA
jgi:ribose/xylose/arabinose/galactoside ABC-type transport system permease subunit